MLKEETSLFSFFFKRISYAPRLPSFYIRHVRFPNPCFLFQPSLQAPPSQIFAVKQKNKEKKLAPLPMIPRSKKEEKENPKDTDFDHN